MISAISYIRIKLVRLAGGHLAWYAHLALIRLGSLEMTSIGEMHPTLADRII